MKNIIQSRCGILCDSCTYKEQVGCKGCVNIEAPFHGKCDIKICCESKSLAFCGECDSFPCELLNQFSYDKEHGDDGLRIKQCKCWITQGENS